jgi:hypothetical protein
MKNRTKKNRMGEGKKVTKENILRVEKQGQLVQNEKASLKLE